MKQKTGPKLFTVYLRKRNPKVKPRHYKEPKNPREVQKSEERPHVDYTPMPATMLIPEPEVCSIFGCGRTLSIREQLFGNKCIHHSKK